MKIGFVVFELHDIKVNVKIVSKIYLFIFFSF